MRARENRVEQGNVKQRELELELHFIGEIESSKITSHYGTNTLCVFPSFYCHLFLSQFAPKKDEGAISSAVLECKVVKYHQFIRPFFNQ